jgi:hypothetical protein
MFGEDEHIESPTISSSVTSSTTTMDDSRESL